MPYKSEKIPIAGTKHDGRRKLSDEQKRAITILHKEGYSFRKLAEMFSVSKWLIQSILNPATRTKPKKYSTEYCTEAKRKYRQKKQELFKNGKIHHKGKTRNGNHTSDKPP